MSYVVKQRIRGKVYVYEAENIYRPEIGQPRQKRIYLGTLGGSGEFMLGKNVAEPGPETLSLLAGAGIDYSPGMKRKRRRCSCGCVMVDGRCPLCSGALSGVFRIGVRHLFGTLAAESGLSGCLDKSFGGRARALLPLAMHRAATGKPLYLAEQWLSGAGVGGFDFSSGNLSRLVRETGADRAARESFLSLWFEAQGRPSRLVCDITSVSTHSGRLRTAEWGYNRDRESLPQVNVALAAGRDGVPLAYRSIPGSVPDVSTLSNTSVFLGSLGFGSVEYSLDKGFYSRANVRRLVEAGHGFVLGVPFSNSAAQKLFSRHLNALKSGKKSFLWNGRVMRHARDGWRVETDSGTEIVAAHLYYEPARAADMKAQFEKRILQLERMSQEAGLPSRRALREWLSEHAPRLAGLFRTVQRGMLFSAERKPKAVASEMKFMGCTLVVSADRDRGREETLGAYRSRDKGEKLFDTLKNEIGQDRLRTGSDTAMEGQLFISFLALALRASLEARMREAGLLQAQSADEAIAEIDKICEVKLTTGRSILQEITKKQRTLLNSLNVPLPEIQ